MKKLKHFYCYLLILLAFSVAFIELILEIVTLTLYSRLMGKVSIKDMVGYKILKLSEKYY